MFAQSKGGNYSLTNGASGVADAIDFDGATDYLSRSSDLAGNADGKTFTFSVWVDRRSVSGAANEYILSNGDDRFTVRMAQSSGLITLECYGATGTLLLRVTGFASNDYAETNTFTHFLVSSNIASGDKTQTFAYIDDIAVSASGITWYSNQNIDFTQTTWGVGHSPATAEKWKGRLSHIYLDYTYRDLSIEANRRLFITADRKPAANQAALNPILYLPLNDPTQPGKNLGTGGDFALNGVVARSGRGPSQFNAPYSDLDGSADYLSRASELSGASAGKQFSAAFCVGVDRLQGAAICIGNSNPSDKLQIQINGAGGVVILAYNSAGSTVISASTSNGTIVVGRNYLIAVSIDLTDTGKRFVTVNGAPVSVTWTTYVNDSIPFNGNRVFVSKTSFGSSLIDGRLGNLFFDTRYIDLSQPANLAKFVTGTGIDAKPADLGANGEKPFGTPPLIYLPMYGNNAGKNYGTGGDFTVNSGPYLGARGPNEYWGNKAAFNGSTGRFNRAAQLSGIADSKTLTFAFSVNKAASVLYTLSDTTGATLRATINASNQLVLLGKNSSGVTILSATVTTTISNTADTSVLICVDLASTSNRAVYLNNVAASVTWTTYTNDSVDLTVSDFSLGSEVTGANYLNGSLSEFYFTTEYIDFSQEANRLKFRDAFGNPVDLAPQIVAGTLPNPAIYMRFDPADFGKNSGTGGDFTVSGTITDGGQL